MTAATCRMCGRPTTYTDDCGPICCSTSTILHFRLDPEARAEYEATQGPVSDLYDCRAREDPLAPLNQPGQPATE